MKQLLSALLILLLVGATGCARQGLRSIAGSSEDRELTEAAKIVFPESEVQRHTFKAVFSLAKNHATMNPYRGFEPPYAQSYSLSSMPFAIAFNVTKTTVDLLLLNWSYGKTLGVELDERLTKLIGQPIHLFRGLAIAALARGNEHLWSWSSVYGQTYFPPGLGNVDQYLEPNHPLRKALGGFALPIVIPGASKIRTSRAGLLGYQDYYTPLLLLLHEGHHLNDANAAKADNKFTKYLIRSEVRKGFEQLTNSQRAACLFHVHGQLAKNAFQATKGAYRRTIAELAVVIKAFNSEFKEAWYRYGDDERTEGFADFAVYQSFIDAGWMSEKQVVAEITADSNNIMYKTGAYAGMFLVKNEIAVSWKRERTGTVPAWEQIVTALEPSTEYINLEELLERYCKDKKAVDGSVKSLIAYWAARN